mgnify:CR=1 FL=1
MMEKKLDTFEELMLDFLAGKLSEDGERKLLHFLQSDISYQQRYKEMARTRAKSFIGKFHPIIYCSEVNISTICSVVFIA